MRGGATLNLKLTGKSYLESGSAPAIHVEQGGTLNLIGGGMAQSSLALMGGLSAASGATVNFKDCAVYAAGKTIGGTGANVSVENCWISAGFAGNLRVTRSTLEGEHSGGTVKIDRRSNANLTDASGKAVTGVTDHSGNPVYRTKVELEDMNQSRNLMMITYRTDAASGTMQSTLYPLVTQLRVNIPNTVNDDIIKDLTMLVGSNTVYLWLPAGTKIMSVEGFQDDGSSPVGFIHDPQKNAPIVTTANNSASGKMILLNLLLASGVLAFRGTPGGDNTALCAGYLGDSAKDTWIDYHPEKDVKLQADWKFITDFGIRMLTGGEAEVKLNGLDLSGPNKRVELDDRSKLSIVLMENTESVMRSNEGSTDAVWTLKGSGGLTIKGQSGGEKLTLRGDHAMDGSTGASLTFNGITLINNCTNKPETTLGKLTISNSTVFGLGTVNCANIVINGGSVDLDVPVNTVVKDSGGNELKKVTLTLSQKNAAVEDVTLSGLPAGTAFDDSHIISDGSGKIYLWIPKDAEVETVTVGGNKYYPKSDGSMTIGDVPEFTSPTEDVSRVVESNEYMTLTVGVVGTPAPALQWQVSQDGGKTWEDIDGATESTYQALLPLSLHGAKFRCAATNKDGTAYSHTFTAYYCPAVLRGAASPMRGNGDFIQGEIATITAGFYDGQTWYPISSLTGVTAEYRWKYCRNVMPTEEEWAAIPPAGESYPITITDEMDYQSVCFHVTLTYPDNTVKTVTGYWRLNVCVTPVVTEQPQSVSAAAGDSVTFSAKLIDQYLNTLEYQWQSSTDGGQSWTDIEGAGGKSTADSWNYTPSYTIPSVTAAQSGQMFRCVLWNTNNHTGSERVSTPPVYSEPATLTVTPPAHEHRYGDWSKDGTNHWHECTDADCPNQSESIKDKAAHIYDDDADMTCNVCGYVRTVTPPAHEHRYGDWSKDGTNHWHECTDADCPEQSESIKDKAAHIYTDDADTTCNVCGYVRTVTPGNVLVTGVALNKTSTSISVGNSETLTATVAPENAANKALKWASSDEDVATVAPDGTVTAVKVGTATITATATDGSGKSATCKVTVTDGTTPSQPGGSTGGSSGGSSSGGGGGSSSTTPTKPETATKPDGTKVETVTKPDGTKVETTTGKDGSVTKTETKAETKPDGTKAETKSETVTNKDGSKVESETRTETRKDGTVTESKTETITSKDGTKSETKSETKTDKNGVTSGTETTKTTTANGSTGMTVTTIENGESKTVAETTLSGKAVEDAKKNGEAVKAPVEVEASRNSNTAPTVKVELPKGTGETKVEIPVSNVKPGTVAVLVHPDGTEELLKDSIPTENGIQLTVDGSATVKIIDNSKGFIDTQDHWAKDAIDFVSARGLVNGMSATIYAPNNSTTRAQLWTILARQNDANLNGGNTWYESAQNWAKVKGVSDGANPNAAINRAQMVTMLWRAMGQPAPATAATFTDVSADSYYAGAVSWAVENGVTTGVGGGRFDPTATCTRAQIAAFLARSMK